MTGRLHFFAPGIPAPKGSKSVGRHGNLYEASPKLPAWEMAVVLHAKAAIAKARWDTAGGPVKADFVFVFPRPKSRPRELHKASAPDKDKLERAVNDCLKKAGAFKDDALVCDGGSTKIWTCEAFPDSGAWVTLTTIERACD